jgi:DNA-binding LytR/AlgR family response regulator
MAVWFGTSQTLNFSFTILFYLSAIIMLILSRTLMYGVHNKLEVRLMTYILWLLVENIIITAIYSIITVHFFPMPGIETSVLASRAFLCVTVILALPNAFIMFYAAYCAKCEELEAMQYQYQQLEKEYHLLDSRQSDLRAVASAITPVRDDAPKMVNLHDNNGTLRLSINTDALYYFESEDNYIKVYYKHNEKLLSYMLRCRTRSVERSLEGTCMVRCHRSFIVNINKIRVMGENRRMHFLTLDDEQVSPIPVSKSYYQSLLSSLNTSTAQPKDGVSVADGTES